MTPIFLIPLIGFGRRVRVGQYSRPALQDFASSGSASGASSGSLASSFDSAVASLAFIAPTNRPVNRPPLRRVLRKNSHVCGQPLVPLVSAVSQPASVLVYSGLWNGLNSHEAVLVMR